MACLHIFMLDSIEVRRCVGFLEGFYVMRDSFVDFFIDLSHGLGGFGFRF